MSLTQRNEIDQMVEEGLAVTQGVLPVLDDRARYYVQLWGTLRSATPGDQPIGLQSIYLLIGREALLHFLPVLQGMDRVLFECMRDRREAERARAEEKAKAARQRGGRR